jgi:hypothetical protein
MNKVLRGRFFVIAFALCVIFTLLFAASFESAHLDHDCCGEGCPVCLHIEVARNILKSLALACVVAVFAGLAKREKTLVNFISAYIFSPNPVLLKVKLTI